MPIASRYIWLGHGCVSRTYQRFCARPTDKTFAHSIHHVSNGESSIEIIDDDRATPATPETHAPSREIRQGGRLRQAVTNPEAEWNSEHQIDTIRLLFENTVYGFR